LLSILKEDGLKFTRSTLIQGFLIVCRVDKDWGESTVIATTIAMIPTSNR
jgi:hypothetical protein